MSSLTDPRAPAAVAPCRGSLNPLSPCKVSHRLAGLGLPVQLLAILLCLHGFMRAQGGGGGQAEIGFQQYYLSEGSQRVANISGLALRFNQFIPDFGLVSASLAPALSNDQFRTGDDYLSLTGLPWKGQHWNFTVGDFRVPGQLVAPNFTNLYVPEINGRGFSMASTHGGRTIGFFYGSETIANTPRVVLRIPVPQTLMGIYIRQRIGERLVLGARLLRFSNNLAALQNTPGLITLDNHLKTATTLSLDALYKVSDKLKWYSEIEWSTSQRDIPNSPSAGGAVSMLAGPIFETPLLTLRGNYMLQSAAYFPILGYYQGDREGPFGEVTLHPFSKVDIYGSASAYQNNVAKDPSQAEFRNSSESAGVTVQLPGRFSLTGQLTLLDLSSRENAATPWDRSRNQQQTASLTRNFTRHNVRVTARDFVEISALNPQRQRSGEIEDILHFKHMLVGGGVRIQRVMGGDSRSTFFTHGTAQIHFGRFSAYTNIETGSDLQNKTLLATNAISTTIFGASMTLGKHWELQGEAYRNNLIAELNPQSIFVLQGQGVFVPGTLTALNQWSMYFRVSRSFNWGQAGSAGDIAQYAIARAPLKGSISGIVWERLSSGNLPASGITVTLDQDRSVPTDAEGRFNFTEVPEGLHRVSLSSEELLADFDPGPNKDQKVLVFPDKASRSELDVIPLALIQGKLAGPPETPLDAVRIRLAPGSRYTTPDADGNFFFYNLREGKYKVSVDEQALPEYASLQTAGSVDVDVVAGKQPQAVTFAFEVHAPAKPVRKIFDKQDLPATQSAVIVMSAPSPAAPPIQATVPAEAAPEAKATSPTTKKPLVAVAPSPVTRPAESAAPPLVPDAGLAQRHYQAGRQLAQERKYWEAITELDDAIRLQSGFAPAYNARGYAFYQLHNYAAAIRDLDEAIRLNPDYSNAIHIRELAQKALPDLTEKAPDAQPAEKQSAPVEKAPEPATDPVPATPSRQAPLPKMAGSDLAQKHNQAARQMVQDKRYWEAIAEFGEVIRLKPDFAAAYNGRGYARYQLHDYAAAIKDLDQAIRLNANYANAYHIRGLARKALADFKGAEADEQRARELEH